LSGRLMVIQSACPRFSRITLLSVMALLAGSLLPGQHLRRDRQQIQERFRLKRRPS
jgi:hypothetical protein